MSLLTEVLVDSGQVLVQEDCHRWPETGCSGIGPGATEQEHKHTQLCQK